MSDPVPAELIPTMTYGDGRPLDVGTDRHITNSLDVYFDTISAHQTPYLNGEQTFAGGAFSERRLWFVMPVFLGLDSLSSTITRSLYVAPWFKSDDGSSVTVYLTLTDTMPTLAPSKAPNSTQVDIRYSGAHSTESWTTTSTTWQTGTIKALNAGVKSIFWGTAFLCAEVSSGHAQLYGLAHCCEGPRVGGS